MLTKTDGQHFSFFFPIFFHSSLPARQEVALSSLSPEEPSTIIQFTYTSNAQMYSLLKRTAAKCSHISHVYSIGRSTEGRDLLVIEFTDNPGQHELREWGGGGAKKVCLNLEEETRAESIVEGMREISLETW